MFVAYFLSPVTDCVEKYVRVRALAVTLVLGVFIAVVALVAVYLLPYIYDQLRQLLTQIPGYVSHIIEHYQPRIDALEAKLGALYPDGGTPDLGVIKSLSGSVVAWMGNFFKGVVSSGVNVINLLSLIFISPIVSFYLLKDWDRILEKLKSLLPKRHKKTVLKLVGEMDSMIAAYVRGMLTVALIVATFYAIGLGLTGLNYGVLIGLMTGLLSFIPYVGIMVGLVVSLIVAVFQYGGEFAPILTVLSVLLVGQFIEGNFVTPKIVGDNLQLHPVWIIFALLSGGVLLGFLGVVIAVPLAAIIGVLLRFGTAHYRKSPLAA